MKAVVTGASRSISIKWVGVLVSQPIFKLLEDYDLANTELAKDPEWLKWISGDETSEETNPLKLIDSPSAGEMSWNPPGHKTEKVEFWTDGRDQVTEDGDPNGDLLRGLSVTTPSSFTEGLEALQVCPTPVKFTSRPRKRNIRQRAAATPGPESLNRVIQCTSPPSKVADQLSKSDDATGQLRTATRPAKLTLSPPLKRRRVTEEMAGASGPQSQEESRQRKRKAKSQPRKEKLHRTSAEFTATAISQSLKEGTGGSSVRVVMHENPMSEVIAKLLKSKDANVLYVRAPVSPAVPSISEAGAKLLAAAEAIVEKSTSEFEPPSLSLPLRNSFESTLTTYGSSAWLLQMYLSHRREDQSQSKDMLHDCSGGAEIQTALALHGFPNVDVSGLFQRAQTIVGYLAADPLTIEDEKIRQAATDNSDVARHAMAAELIHAAFLTKPFIKNIPAYIAEHNNHQAIHNNLIDSITNTRFSIFYRRQARERNAKGLAHQDWLAMKRLYRAHSKRPSHPFSFPQFLRDVDLVWQKAGASACSKYNKIFNIDLESELQQLRDTYTIHPAPLAFIQGMKHGFVPSRYAKFYITKTPSGTTFMFGLNSQALAGALVLMYKDLILGSGLCVADLEANVDRSLMPQEGYERLAELDELVKADERLEDVMCPSTPASEPPLTRLQRYLLEGQ